MAADSLQLHRPDQSYMSEDEANDLIKKYDKNGDSILTKDELTAMLLHQANSQASAKLNPSKPQEHIAAVVPKVSSKGDVESEKKSSGKSQKVPAKVGDGEASKASNIKLSRMQMKEIFREHDIDGDGCLSISEMTKAFSFLGSILPFYKAHYGLSHADANKDGLISEDELDKLIDYAEKVTKKKCAF